MYADVTASSKLYGVTPHVGEDFNLEVVTVLTFLPGQQKLPVPFKLFQDAIAEETEEFRLYLSAPQYSALYKLGSLPFTDVYIHDNDSK